MTPEDGVVVCRAGNLHRFWVDVDGEDGEQEDVVLLLNATDSGKDFVLDRVFFENWYGMRYDSLTYGDGIDLVQMLCVSVGLFIFGLDSNLLFQLSVFPSISHSMQSPLTSGHYRLSTQAITTFLFQPNFPRSCHSPCPSISGPSSAIG